MKKKVVSVLLCVAMTATMLLGCSAGSEKSDSKKSSKSESGGTTEMKVDGDATTINVWTFIELHQNSTQRWLRNGMRNIRIRRLN